MYWQLQVHRVTDLVVTRYFFIMLGREVVLDYVTVARKASRRHKYRQESQWSRLEDDSAPRPEVPDDVIAEVRKALAEIPIR